VIHFLARRSGRGWAWGLPVCLALLPTRLTWGQVVLISDGAVFDLCVGMVCDPGGTAGTYPNGTTAVASVCPTGGPNAGPATTLRFVEWDVAPGPGDRLMIHQGNTDTGSPFAVGTYDASLLDQVITSNHSTGCLTLTWETDATGTAAGWKAVILTGPQAGEDAVIEVPMGAAPFALFDSIAGFPETGGIWTAPNGTSCDGTFDPLSDPFGSYTYSLPAEASCPARSATVSVQMPQNASAGTNGTLTLCTTSGIADLFAALGGTPDPGGTWTDPNGDPTDGSFDPANEPAGAYTYTVQCDPEPCVDPTATVTVTVNQPPSAGTSTSISVCSDLPAFDLFTRLGGTPDAGGAWTGPGGTAVPSTFTPGSSTPGTYTYSVLGVPPCANAAATVTVAVVNAPNAGTGNTFTVCSNSPSFALISRLGGTPQGGGTWTGPGGAHGPNFVPGTDVAGTYTYTVAGTSPCLAATANLVINVQAAPNAGTNASTTVCSTDASFGLFPLLGGSPNGGGIWTAPGGGAFSGTFVPGTSAPGVYTYTVAGIPPCPNAIATVTVAVNAAPNAGTNATVTHCSNAPQFNLFAVLGGTPSPGGTWTAPGGSASNGTFTPGTSNPGPYTYTVMGIAPCANATAVVTVNIVQAPNAGTNGNTTVCATSASFQLFGLLGGTPNPGGSWTAPGGAAHNGTFTPGTSVPGTYTYTALGTSPCSNANSTVTVGVVQPPDPGGNGSLTVCSNGASVSLFNSLSGTPDVGGTWTRPNGQPHSGTLNPVTDTVGTYTYTVNGTAPCSALSSTVQVAKVQAPEAGTNGAITVCSTMAPFQLFTVLGGTPSGSGSWRTPANAPFSGTFTPGSTPAGVYKYVVNGTAPCENDTAFVTVTVNTAPNAGTNGTVEVCSNQPSFQLITQLGGTPNGGGTWTDPGGQVVPSGAYLPGTSAPGAYTYTVAGLSPCLAATAVVSVTERRQPVAGTNATRSLCSTDAPVNLFTSLGGTPDAGGSWTAPGGGPGNAIFTPGSSPPGVHTYTVAGVSPCSNAAATVAITVNQAPDAGMNATVSVCADAGDVDLFDELGGTPTGGGTWTDDDATGQMSSGVFTPSGMPPGDYDFTYAVPGSGQCGADQATVRVTIVAALDAGTNGSLTVCGSNALVDLFPGLGGTPQPGGSWSDLSGTGALTGQFFNATQVSAGTYTFEYELSGSVSCAADEAMVSVTVVAPRQPGNNGSSTVCSSSGSLNLFTLLGGDPETGGTWSPGTGIYNPPVNDPGVFTYTLTGTGPCPNASATVTVVEVAAPIPGNPATTTVCSSDGPFNMTLRLGGSPQAGSWSFGGAPHSNIFVPQVDAPGVYIHTVPGSGPCSSATASLTVNVNQAANAGGNGDTTVCSNSTSFVLFDLLTGNPTPGGTWTRPGPVGHSGFYQPPVDAPGDYTYTVVGTSPCPADIAIVTVTEHARPLAGTSGSTTLCAGGANVNLITVLGGTPGSGGTWTGPAPATTVFNGLFIPGVTAPGTYTYTVTGPSPCANATAQATISVLQPPNPGTSRTITVCDNATGFAMIDSLGGSPALANGTWTGPAPSTNTVNGFFNPSTASPGTYVYTYTVSGTSPCASASSTLTIVVNPRANAGVSTSYSACASQGSIPMLPLLGPNAQVGGTWRRQSDGTSHSGVFQPGVDAPGVYVYRVIGPLGCAPHEATVAMTVNQPPNAGSNGQIIVCDDDEPFSLLGILNGNPQTPGSWKDPLLNTHIGVYIPGQSLPGVYTYSVAGTSPCGNAQAQVNVIENHQPDAGSNGVITICSNAQPFSLFTVLTGTPELTGTWYNPGNVQVGDIFTPGSSVAGVYKYRITGSAPCQTDSATATVIVNAFPNAGISSAVQVCAEGPLVALIDLLDGSPSTSGSWSYGGNAHSQFLDPATDLGGAYLYTVAGLTPCANATAQVQVTLVPPPHAGVDGNLAACVGDDAIQLAAGLGGAPHAGGSWSDDDGTGQMTGGVLDASGLAPGTYHFTYTVAGSGPCLADQAMVTLTLANALDAGQDGTVTICQNELLNLFTTLGGTPQQGGVWSDVDGSGGLIGGVFNANGVAAGTTWHFRYVIPGTASCSSDTAIVTVSVQEGPFAGCDGFKAFCLTEAPGNLISSISCDPDPTGSWLSPANLPHTGIFQPATDQPGVYKYVVPGVGSCAADTALVTVQVRTPPNAGDDDTLRICSNDTPVDLFSLLGPNAQTGGTWTIFPSPVIVSGIYNPAVDGPAAYVYRVQGQMPCVADQAIITVIEPVAPFAGNDRTMNVCSSDAAFNMLNELGGLPQQGGTWYTGAGAVHVPTFNPLVEEGDAFTYVILGATPCVNDTARLTINRSLAPFAGTSATISACATQTEVDLFAALGPGAGTDGTWTDVNATGALAGNLFDPSVVGNGTYEFRYVITATSPCINSEATITVHVGSGADAGDDNTLTICGAETRFSLFEALDGDPDPGGSWTDLNGTGAIVEDSLLNATAIPPGGQNAFVYTIEDPGCGAVQATLLISTVDYPDPGSAPAPMVICASDPVLDLAALLGGDPDEGGTWSAPSGAFTGDLDPATHESGDYVYTVAGNTYCPDSSAVFQITINQRPDAGTPGQVVVCDTLPAFPLFPVLNGTPDGGGTWLDLSTSGGLSGGNLNTTGLAPGDYDFQYTVQVPGCAAASSMVKVEVVSGPVAVDLTTTCNEVDRTYTVSFTIEGGDPTSYMITGDTGTISTNAPHVFVSGPIVVSRPFSAVLSDAFGCAEFHVVAQSPCHFDTEVFIPQSFSPNDDAVNDRFIIPGIEGFPNNTLSIFNRWGAKVFDGAAYDNQRVVWDGSSPDALIPGQAPAGTYFYVLDLGTGAEPFTGYIQLTR